MATADVKRHWNRLADMGCIVCLAKPATIHHCHGGSMRGLGVFKAGSMKTSDWLTLPLCVKHHVGDRGVDRIGVKKWEGIYGHQSVMLEMVSERVGYDVIEKSREEARGY